MLELNKDDLKTKIGNYQYIVIDKKVYDQHLFIHELVEEKCFYFIKGNPEESKNLKEYEKIIDFFISSGINRQDSLLAIGGGAVSDLTGFVAATILRGISWSVVPTTFLAMIDASIGGKVGINNSFGKNLIGAFHLPQHIYIFKPFLKTLKESDYKSGMGELIKYFFISSKLENLKSDNIEDYIIPCGEIKNEIVSNDFKESGNRIVLNFGHTFGHAIEKCLSIPHGVAVYYGIQMINDFLQPSFNENLQDLVLKLQLRFGELTKMDFNQFWSFLEKDKKKIGKSVNFILTRSMGKPYGQRFDLDELKDLIKNHEKYKDYFQ